MADNLVRNWDGRLARNSDGKLIRGDTSCCPECGEETVWYVCTRCDCDAGDPNPAVAYSPTYAVEAAAPPGTLLVFKCGIPFDDQGGTCYYTSTDAEQVNELPAGALVCLSPNDDYESCEACCETPGGWIKAKLCSCEDPTDMIPAPYIPITAFPPAPTVSPTSTTYVFMYRGKCFYVIVPGITVHALPYGASVHVPHTFFDDCETCCGSEYPDGTGCDIDDCNEHCPVPSAAVISNIVYEWGVGDICGYAGVWIQVLQEVPSSVTIELQRSDGSNCRAFQIDNQPVPCHPEGQGDYYFLELPPPAFCGTDDDSNCYNGNYAPTCCGLFAEFNISCVPLDTVYYYSATLLVTPVGQRSDFCYHCPDLYFVRWRTDLMPINEFRCPSQVEFWVDYSEHALGSPTLQMI